MALNRCITAGIEITLVWIGISNFFIFKNYICACSAKIVDKCLPPGFCRYFFVYAPLTSSSNWKTETNASGNKTSIKFYNPQWTVDNTRTNTMVAPCQKNARHVFMYSTDQYKKAHQEWFSTACYMWTTWARQNFHPAVENIGPLPQHRRWVQ